ncbi:unnamed protein product [Trichogramma brassicae]|uniref:Uncharacterized protein n=1 Tax=Trichogramma brassicae TaxID=86971 RepID=A0A6H5INV1_9HYME|nr:unnamed protein product [Trichogramma brassicae]
MFLLFIDEVNDFNNLITQCKGDAGLKCYVTLEDTFVIINFAISNLERAKNFTSKDPKITRPIPIFTILRLYLIPPCHFKSTSHVCKINLKLFTSSPKIFQPITNKNSICFGYVPSKSDEDKKKLCGVTKDIEIKNHMWHFTSTLPVLRGAAELSQITKFHSEIFITRCASARRIMNARGARKIRPSPQIGCTNKAKASRAEKCFSLTKKSARATRSKRTWQTPRAREHPLHTPVYNNPINLLNGRSILAQCFCVQAWDGKSNTVAITSITTEDGKRYKVPEDLMYMNVHEELKKTTTYTKVKANLKRRHDNMSVWFILNEELQGKYFDEAGNLEIAGRFLNEMENIEQIAGTANI